jgi:hypothetical protein
VVAAVSHSHVCSGRGAGGREPASLAQDEGCGRGDCQVGKGKSGVQAARRINAQAVRSCVALASGG